MKKLEATPKPANAIDDLQKFLRSKEVISKYHSEDFMFSLRYTFKIFLKFHVSDSGVTSILRARPIIFVGTEQLDMQGSLDASCPSGLGSGMKKTLSIGHFNLAYVAMI
jgi:hypothetical protein